MADEAMKGAEHVLTHGTARTRAASGGGRSNGSGGSGGSGGGHESAGGEKKLRSIEVEKAKKGAIAIHHHHKPHDKPEHDEKYPIADQKALAEHMEEHMPLDDEAAMGGGEESGGMGGAAAPGAGAPAAAGGAPMGGGAPEEQV